MTVPRATTNTSSHARGDLAGIVLTRVGQHDAELLPPRRPNCHSRAGSPATFKQLFPGGCWAAWVPLSLHLYDDGAGTRPD